MQVPPLESGFMFLNVYFMVLLTYCMKDEVDDKEKVALFLGKISQIKSPTIY
jgi:hypothetical protein